MKLFLVITTVVLINQCHTKMPHFADKVWGEVNESTVQHRGKAGLILLELMSDKTFRAYENTDYGASVLQRGNWNAKNNTLTFEVSETKNYAKHITLKGKIFLEKEIGKITNEIKKLTDNKLILFNQEQGKRLVFEKSELNYFPDN